MDADSGADMGGIGGRNGDVGTEMGGVDDDAESDDSTLESLGYVDDSGSDGTDGGSADSGTSTRTAILYAVVFLVALLLLVSTFL